MTQPTEQPTNEQQRRVSKGARTVLEARRQIPGRITDSSADRIVVTFGGTADLDRQLTELGGDTQAHLVFTVAHVRALSDVTLTVFIDTPDATADTPADSAGFAGTVAFFPHEEGHHGQPRFRIPLTGALGRLGPRRTVLTSTFVPVALPGRARTTQPIRINAALHLVRSRVER